jgi:hypothetical protein
MSADKFEETCDIAVEDYRPCHNFIPSQCLPFAISKHIFDDQGR